MLKIGLFFLLAPFALIELLFYQRFDLLLLGGLYFGLTAQADWSADRFLRREATREAATEEAAQPPEEIELSVPPLGRKAPRAEASAASRASDQEATQPTPRPGPAVANLPFGRPARAPRRLPASPRFNGPAHEVLGVAADAQTRTIVNAFRHWIKRFHPDKAIGLPSEMANQRVQRLTEAKNALLERRKGRRAA